MAQRSGGRGPGHQGDHERFFGSGEGRGYTGRDDRGQGQGRQGEGRTGGRGELGPRRDWGDQERGGYQEGRGFGDRFEGGFGGRPQSGGGGFARSGGDGGYAGSEDTWLDEAAQGEGGYEESERGYGQYARGGGFGERASFSGYGDRGGRYGGTQYGGGEYGGSQYGSQGGGRSGGSQYGGGQYGTPYRGTYGLGGQGEMRGGGVGSMQGTWQEQRGRGDSQQRGRHFGKSPQGYTRSDDRIREEICDRLMQGDVDPSEISVRVSGGEVTLEGRVEGRDEKYHVETLAESVLGVKDVDNRLKVSRGRSDQASSSMADDTSSATSSSSPSSSEKQQGTSRGNRTTA